MPHTLQHYDVIVIGGGASGLMAAGRAAERGKKVLLVEKNKELGRKISISGGGRCNILNAEEDVRALLAHYGEAAKFLFTPFATFGMQETRDFFEKQLGLPIAVEGRKRAFPKSNKASDVVKVLREWCVKSGVRFLTGHVAKILTEETVREPESSRENSLAERSEENRGLFREKLSGSQQGRSVTGVICDKVVYTADAYVIATGGLSHPETGSTGDGFGWLRDLGHTVVDPTPTIVPLAVADEGMGRLVKKLSGTTLQQAKITFYVDGVKKFAREGDILCTHFGLSGPTILNVAGKVAELLKTGEVTARIDLFPKSDLGALDQDVVALFEQHKNKDVDNALASMLPTLLTRELLRSNVRSLASHIHDRHGVLVTPKVHSFGRDERKAFVQSLKNISIEITGLLGFDKAVVADGGVPLSEIGMETFASTKVDNLYITGDLLHINRPSGGYSLQLCWTSGYVAGSSV